MTRLLLLLLFCPAELNAAENMTFSLSRFFTMKACNTDGKCMGPTPEDLDKAKQVLTLEPFKKGDKQGWHAYDRSETVINGITFKSELHVIRWKKTDKNKNKYYIYALLRSGDRAGTVQMLNLKNLSKFKETVLEDKPVSIGSGTLQAQLIFGP